MTYDSEAKRRLLRDDLLSMNVAESPLLALSVASSLVQAEPSSGDGGVSHLLVIAPGYFDTDGAATIESLAELLVAHS